MCGEVQPFEPKSMANAIQRCLAASLASEVQELFHSEESTRELLKIGARLNVKIGDAYFTLL